MRDPEDALTGFATMARRLRDIAHQLAAQVEPAAARGDREVMAERDRIARNLDDRVIQRVFGAGLALKGITNRLSCPDTATRIHAVVDELNATIRELRGTILDLNQPVQQAAGLRARFLHETTAAQNRLRFAPQSTFTASSTPPCSMRPPPTCPSAT
jgi:signal transduction histidine kinase